MEIGVEMNNARSARGGKGRPAEKGQRRNNETRE